MTCAAVESRKCAAKTQVEIAPARILSKFDQAKVPEGITLQDKGLDMA